MNDRAKAGELEDGGALARLGERMAKSFMRGQWQNETNRGEGAAWVGDVMLPVARGKAWIWRAEDVRSCLDDAAIALPESMTSRRSVLFNNPGLPRGTVATINMGIQMILPGEVAWAHRHSISALRFVIKGDPLLSTAVEGTGCPMETGDLVLTPGGSWHDHYNGSPEPMLWLDVLDGPVMSALNQTVFQNYGEKRQPLRNSAAGATVCAGGLRYSWSTVKQELESRPASAMHNSHGLVYSYLDPLTGRHPMKTLGCKMHLFPSGFEGTVCCDRSNAVFHVFRGAGKVNVDGQDLMFSEGDSFTVPGWSKRSFCSSEGGPVYLFEVNDEPLLENLGLLNGDLPDRVRKVQEGEVAAGGR